MNDSNSSDKLGHRKEGGLKKGLSSENTDELYKLLFQQAPYGIFISDDQNNIVDANRHACRILGYKKEELIGLNADDIIHPDDLQTNPGITKKEVLESKDDLSILRRFRKKDTTYVTTEVILKALENSPNYFVIFRDVTGQEQMKYDLLESEKKYRTLFENAGDAIFFMKAQGENAGKIIDANQSAAKMHGLALDELLGMNISELDSPEDAKDVPSKIKRMIDGEWIHTEVVHRKKDGTMFPVEISAGMVEFGTEKYFLAFDRDITDRKKAEAEKESLEAQLRQTQKMEAIGTLAGGIAHDFNNILSGIYGYAYLARKNAEDTEKVKGNIEQIIKGANKATELVKQILTFSRDAKQEKVSLKIYILIKEALKLLRSSIPSTIEIKEQISSRSPVLVEPTKIHQIMMNLCTNAYHAMHERGGTLTVKLNDVRVSKSDSIPGLEMVPGAYVELLVSDTGCGISQEKMEKIFDPYFTTKEAGQGTGLGLAVVHGIVNEHNGYVLVESGPGNGACFKVYFPVSQRPARGNKEKKDISLTTGKGNILIVDDEQDVLDVTGDMLKSLGYQVTEATGSPEAFEMFKNTKDAFDLVITDKMTGDVLTSKILDLRPEIPVILCTGYSEKINREKAFQIGIKDFLAKPVKMEDLSEAVRKLLPVKEKK